MRGKEILVASILTLGTLELSRYAFRQNTKETLKERAYNRFGKVCSEISGRDDTQLHAAHISHKRKTGYYNSSLNGFYCTIDEHLIDHVLRDGENGLTAAANHSAINGLTKTVVQEFGRGKLEELYDFVSQDNIKNEWYKKIEEAVKDDTVIRKVRRLDAFYRKTGSTRL